MLDIDPDMLYFTPVMHMDGTVAILETNVERMPLLIHGNRVKNIRHFAYDEYI